MSGPVICCFGAGGSFDVSQIGGTDSYFRRIGLALTRRERQVVFLHYGCKEDSEELTPSGIRVLRHVRFADALDALAGFRGSVLVSALRKQDRPAFMLFRRKHRRNLRFYLVPSVYYESALHHELYFLEALLAPYNGGVLAMSPRLAAAARRRRNRAELLLPPVPEDYYVQPEAKNNGRLTVTYMGRTVPGKGADEAVEVFERLKTDPNLATRVCGYIWPDDREDTSIHERLLGQDGIRYDCETYHCWTPDVDRNVAAVLKETDILVLPYRLLSSTIDMPLLLLEGMAANCVVITTPLGDMPEIYGTSDFMLPFENFADGAVELIRQAPGFLEQERRRLAAHTRAMAFNTESIVDRLLEIEQRTGSA